jgi:carbon storage regulator
MKMLVLTRKPNEGIVINDRITVMVLEVRGNQIRLGIEAPKEIPIKREELCRSAGGGKRGEEKGDILRFQKTGMSPFCPLRLP